MAARAASLTNKIILITGALKASHLCLILIVTGHFCTACVCRSALGFTFEITDYLLLCLACRGQLRHWTVCFPYQQGFNPIKDTQILRMGC